MLVNAAIKHKCATICLMKHQEREEKAKDQNAEGDNLVLRNWTYFGLKTKIEYKSGIAGIKVITQ